AALLLHAARARRSRGDPDVARPRRDDDSRRHAEREGLPSEESGLAPARRTRPRRPTRPGLHRSPDEVERQTEGAPARVRGAGSQADREPILLREDRQLLQLSARPWPRASTNDTRRTRTSSIRSRLRGNGTRRCPATASRNATTSSSAPSANATSTSR